MQFELERLRSWQGNGALQTQYDERDHQISGMRWSEGIGRLKENDSTLPHLQVDRYLQSQLESDLVRKACYTQSATRVEGRSA